MLFMKFMVFSVCQQVTSYKGNGALVLCAVDRRFMMTVRHVIVARVKLSSTAARMESKRATSSRCLCLGVLLNVRNHNALKFNNNNMKNNMH